MSDKEDEEPRYDDDDEEEEDIMEDDDGDEENGGGGRRAPSNSSAVALNIASAVLFGNIDNEGRLTDDFLDEESKRHLGSLQQHLNDIVPMENIIERGGDDSAESRSRRGDGGGEEGDDGKEDDQDSANFPDDNCKCFVWCCFASFCQLLFTILSPSRSR